MFPFVGVRTLRLHSPLTLIVFHFPYILSSEAFQNVISYSPTEKIRIVYYLSCEPREEIHEFQRGDLK